MTLKRRIIWTWRPTGPLNALSPTMSLHAARMRALRISTFLPFHHVSCNNNRDHIRTDMIV